VFHPTDSAHNIRFEIFHTFHEVKGLWMSILPNNHHLQCPDIQALEKSMPDDIHFKYVNIYEKDTFIGLMYLQCLNFNSKHYRHQLLDGPFIKPIKQLILRKSADILICGNIFRVNFQGFYFKDKSHKERIFDYLLMYRKQVKSEKDFCGILVKDCSRAFKGSQYNCHNFKAFEKDLTMEMELDENWNHFDDYLNDLSRKYRQRANKIVKSKLKIEYKELNIKDLIREKEAINELYMNIVKQQTIAMGLLNSDYFIHMKEQLGEAFKVHGYYKEGELIAFSSHIHYMGKNKMEIHYIGLNYEYNQTYNLYFNILFDGIKSAIEHRFATIEMGRTAREAKANVGAIAVENFNYIWLRPGILRFALNSLGSWFEKQVGDNWKNRHPFKSNLRKEAIEAIVKEA
jgi:hypothetical protein